MNAAYNQIGTLIVRGVAIYIFLRGVAMMGLILTMFFAPDVSAGSKFIAAASPLLTAILVTMMWLKAPQLGRVMASTPSDQLPSMPFSFEKLQETLLIAVGFLILSFSIKPIIYSMVSLGEFANDGSRIGSGDWINIFQGILYLALGMLMIFSSRGVMRMIKLARGEV